MISKIVIPILLLILLPDVWLWLHRRKVSRFVVWPLTLASLAMCIYTIWFASLPDYSSASTDCLIIYLLLLCVVFVPKVIVVGCYAWSRRIKSDSGMLRALPLAGGIALSLVAIYISVYGMTIGFRQLQVTRFDYCSTDIPEAFDGYRIVLFSDLHIGSYITKLMAGADCDNASSTANSHVAAVVDSIRAQHADLIVFAGDLQNMRPHEVEPFRHLLATLRAPDGVIAILGNHDYSEYVGGTDEEKRLNEQQTIETVRSLGWDLLMDDNRKVRRGSDSIVVAGMENVSDKPAFADKGDMTKTMSGVEPDAFTIMLQHDPRTWRKRILPETSAQLTLSGHTHAGQICLFGYYPVGLAYKEYYGLYTDKSSGRALYVSSGIGGFVPFRFNVPSEIVVITLRSSGL